MAHLSSEKQVKQYGLSGACGIESIDTILLSQNVPRNAVIVAWSH